MKNLPSTSQTNCAAGVRPLLTALLAAALVAAVAPGVRAQGAINGGQSPTPNVDKRHALQTPALSGEKKNAERKLEQLVPGLKISVDRILNSPHWVESTSGFLTGPNGQGGALANSHAQNASHQAIVKSFLNENAALFGHGGEVLNAAKATRDYVTDHNGLHTMIWQQELDDIPVFEAVLMAHVTKNGELVNVSTHFLADPAAAAHNDAAARATLKAAPPISAREALLIAARDVGQYLDAQDVQAVDQPSGAEQSQKLKSGKLHGNQFVQLTWLPMAPNDVRLCWQVLVTSGNPIERFRTLVDAQTGEVLVRHNLTRHLSNASYRVWTSDSPSPFSPGLRNPSTFQPAVVARQLVTISALSTNASPNGWIDDNNNTTTGNNVDCFLDRNGDFRADGPRPVGNPNRVFDFPVDLTQDPSNYTDASVLQMFYWQNWYHDTMYNYGFTEAAGNYQTDNFNRGGLSGDPIIAHCQFGAAVGIADNSAFLPAPDGTSGEIIEFIFSGPTPNRDGALDNDVYLHESTHGLSERLVGGGVGISELQPGGMGEGWSDFYALSLLSQPGDDVNGNYAAGGYVTYNFFGLTQNYYYGVRHYPYSTDMTKNPFTLKDIDPTQISAHTGVPMSPVYSPFSTSEADEVHHQGEVWCATLWDVRANLVNKYGDTAGNQLMLQLVTDGMKLAPANPTFLEARDAIIAADRVDNNATNSAVLWAGFAKRGMGAGAFVPDSSTTIGVIESFDVPGLAYWTNSIIGGNNNGVVDPNECNDLAIVLTNRATATIGSISAKLISQTPGAFVTQPFSTWPSIPATNSATCLTPFRISTTPEIVCGTALDFTLIITSDLDVRTNSIRLVVGNKGSPVSFQNTTAVIIPDANTAGIMSPITVSNFVGGLAHAQVSLFISHTFDSDLMMELIAPDGTKVLLSQNNGLSGDNYGGNCTPASQRTTFDDDATNAITAGTAPFIGTFKPQQPLSAFNLKSGTNINGVWNLHIVDQALQDIGTLNCWTLSLTPSICTDGGGECPGSDLAVTMTDNPDPVLVTSNLTYTMIVSNNGPATAKSVVLNQTLPTTVQFLSATTTQGVVTQSLGTITANLGVLPVYGFATITVTVVPLTNGLISSTAIVTSPAQDGDHSNNSATVFTRVEKPTADIAVSMTASPNPALNGGSITYSIVLTNNGPFTATGVVLTNFLPPNSIFVSAATTQGTFANFGSSILALLGNLSTGTTATVTFEVSPTSTGILTATAQAGLDPFIIDPVPGNNRASVQTTVNPAADISVSAFATPDPVVLGSNVTYTITVTNRGPNSATGVTVADLLPNGATFISASTSRGTVTNLGATVLCSMGSMVPGDYGIVTVVVRAPNLSGTLVSVITASSSQSDPNVGNNSVTLRTTVAAPFVRIVAAGSTLVSESLNPHNGIIDIGETVTLQLRLQNIGNAVASGLTATLLSGGGVTAPSGVQSYGSLAGGAAATAPFTFTATGANGGTVTATLQLQTNGVNAGTATFTFPLPQTTVFSNTSPITIVDATASAPSAANPYPSAIQVSGITGFVSHVAVTLNNLSHTYPDDIGALVAHPSGRSSLLMAHAGGGSAASHINLTFDRGSSVSIPDDSQLTSAQYVPAAYGDPFAFPTNLSLPTPPFAPNLAAFEGINPNGNWYLFMADDSQGDSGNVAGGWTVAVTTGTPVNPIAEVSVTSGLLSNPLNPIVVGNNVSFQVVVKNNGPFDATGIQVTNLLSSGLSLVSVSAPSSASYTSNSQSVTFTVPQLPFGSNVVFTVTAQANAVGVQSDTINVGANELDLNVGNNTAVQTVIVGQPSADVAVSATASANPLILGNNLVFNVSVTNRGPNVALDTTLSYVMPFGLNGVTAVTSQGTATINGSFITVNFGNLAPHAGATATITVGPTVPEVITNTFNLTTASIDPNASDNSVALTSTIIQNVPSIVATGIKLISESGVQNGAVDQNETVTVQITFANVGTAPATNLLSDLITNSTVSPIVGFQVLGFVAPGASVVGTYTFTGLQAAGGTDAITVALADTGGGSGYFFPFPTFYLSVPSTGSFTNGAGLSIPSSGPASPYPSTITIANTPGVVSKAVLKLSKVTHAFPHDINVLLVSPSGQSVLALAHCGGAHSINNVDLTFDDSAAGYLAETDQITAGTYKPSAYTPTATFPGITSAPTGSSMSALNGSTANGTWSLYVLDDNNGDSGSIGGWSLDLTVANTINPSAALSLTLTGSRSTVLTGNLIDYVVTVVNAGPATANNLVISDTLPAGVALVSSSISSGTTDVSGNVLNLRVPSLAAGATAAGFIRVQAVAAGNATNSATVSADVADLYPTDNTASFVTAVTQATAAQLAGSYVNGNGFNLVLTGQTGEPYVVQFSTNLTSWVSISTNTPVNGTFTITDGGATSSKTRYYRAFRAPH